jgi:hypothetical protein
VFPNVLFVPSKGDESVQVLYVFARKEPLRLIGPSHVSEAELHSYQQLFSYPLNKGVVVTDDRNPLQLEWAAVASHWRRDSKHYLDFLLSTVE